MRISTLSAVGAACLFTGAAVMIAAPAHADEAPALTTVLWSAPSASAPWPQAFVGSTPGDHLEAYGPELASLECGTYYQADVYPADKVAGLGPVLEEGEDYGVALHWKTFVTPKCEVVPSATPTPTETPTPTASPTVPAETPAPTPAPTSAPTTRPTAPSPEPSATSTATPAAARIANETPATELAMTGSSPWWPGLLVGFVFLVAGLTAYFIRPQKAEVEDDE